MNTIRFYRGEENGIVKEEAKFAESLFREQYVQALIAVDKILAYPTSKEPSIVAFVEIEVKVNLHAWQPSHISYSRIANRSL